MALKNLGILLEQDKVDITPMIDIVFLLLIYFLWTTDLTQEADLGLQLPVDVPTDPTEEPPGEYLVDILPSGEIRGNGVPMDSIDSRQMPQLINTLKRLNETAQREGSSIVVTIFADPQSLHQRSIDVMNACAEAGIKGVTFAQSG